MWRVGWLVGRLLCLTAALRFVRKWSLEFLPPLCRKCGVRARTTARSDFVIASRQSVSHVGEGKGDDGKRHKTKGRQTERRNNGRTDPLTKRQNESQGEEGDREQPKSVLWMLRWKGRISHVVVQPKRNETRLILDNDIVLHK